MRCGILATWNAKGAGAVLIDSLTAYRTGVTGERHLTHHLSQLLDYRSHHRVTTILTIESAELTSLTVTDPIGVSYLSDNVILLRFFEAGGKVRRAINVLEEANGKARDDDPRGPAHAGRLTDR